MRVRRLAALRLALRLVAGLALSPLLAAPRPVGDLLSLRPDAVVDLRTSDGAALVGANWSWQEVPLVEAGLPAPGPDLRPGPGLAVRTLDLASPGSWEPTAANDLERRRGTGRVSFVRYRLSFTLPERIGGTEVAGATVVFEIVVDDYAEVRVDGRLPKIQGAAGGPLVAGWNAPNRVVVDREARPGATHVIEVFAANGPLSEPPANWIWIRSASLDLYGRTRADAVRRTGGTIERLDPALDALVPGNPVIEQVAEGFTFLEGPVWHPDGFLLASDPNENTIWRWDPDGIVSPFRVKSGYSGPDLGRYRQPGSNGLALDGEGRLVVCEHGRRRVVRIERNGTVTVLADRYRGRRLNSPNDVIVGPDGAVWFTDPPFGLPGFADDPAKELPGSTVFRWKDGALSAAATDLAGPNGLALSPDGRILYVANWDLARKVVRRYPVSPDGTLGPGTDLFDLTGANGEEALDGLEVDAAGNLFVCGPGGVWIVSPAGRALGVIRAPELPANLAWGDADRHTLYMAARTGLYRVRLLASGAKPPAPPGIEAPGGTARP